MSDLVARLREYTCGYCNDRPFLVTDEAADEIERLKAELAAVRLDIIICKNNYAVGAEEEERLESELAAANESRRAWASAHLVEIENVGSLEAELAKQKKCIEAVRAFHIESDGVCIHCEWSWPCRTIRALADPAPQESHAGSFAGITSAKVMPAKLERSLLGTD